MKKECTVCHEPKTPSEFYPDPRLKTGLRSSCKSCTIAGRQPNTLAKNERAYRERIRLKALMYYSDGFPQCKCCGETTLVFLCIDHTNGNGCEHRKELAKNRKTKNVGSSAVYIWLKHHNYPEGFQVLCFNCNMAKTILGQCPHQTRS